MTESKLSKEEDKAYKIFLENYRELYKDSKSTEIKDILWDELMDRYHNGKEDDTRDINWILDDVLHYSGFNKVKQKFYSQLCNGRGVRILRKKIHLQILGRIVDDIGTKDKVFYDSLFCDVRKSINCVYIEMKEKGRI